MYNYYRNLIFLSDNEDDVLQATDILCARYKQNRFIPSVDDWPPYHPEHYTPLTIVHHQQMRTESEVKNVAQEMSATDIWTETQCSEIYNRAITNINDLFEPFENTTSIPYKILIEGAPGIGKTELSKEIALQWANNSILKEKKLLFLLFARDPRIKKITKVQLLVEYFCHSDLLSNKITDWLVKTDGKHLTIVFDGYDEVSTDRKTHCIIDSIIAREVLTQCSVVITSRPIASSRLHGIVNCRAEVLGFTEKDRQDFIRTALDGQNDKIKELNEYLGANQHLDLLCYVPLNMSILLCLAKKGIDTLPKTQTVLYKNFILMTITHFLNKDKLLPTTSITKFTDLPHPYDQLIKELSQFAFLALQKDQLVFTLAEVKAECPNLTPANWYGLGLLKSAKYFEAQDGCDHESFHFLHYSVQEYMAAYHIASLSGKKRLTLLEETFWNVRYFNTWIMYVGITGGKHHAFAHFLSGNYLQVTSRLSTPKKLSKKLLNNKIKCLHLLHCSAEADCEILSSVENIFEGQIIDLSNNSLSVNDIRTLAVLLLRSPDKEWETLNLSRCNIDDSGCNIFCGMFHSQKVTLKIRKVDISYNNIQWESLSRLCQIFKLWQTKELVISFDALYDSATMDVINDFTNKINKSIHTYFIIGKLFPGTLLCAYIAEQQKMIVVYLDFSSIVIDQLDNCKLDDITINKFKAFIAQKRENHFINVNHVTFSYKISYNEASIKSTILSHYVQKITYCGSNMHSKGAYLMSTPSVIQHNNKPQQIVADYLAAVMCHNIQTNSSYIKTIPRSIASTVNGTLKNISDLNSCVVININIGVEAATDIATVLFYINKLEKLHLVGNNLQSAGAIKIARGLQNTVNLTWLNLSSNSIGEEAADDIAAVLSHNLKLQTVGLGGNNLQSPGAIKIARSLQNTVILTCLNLFSNSIGEEAADDIAAVLSHNLKLQIVGLGGNNLQSPGAIKIARSLQNTVTLTYLNLSSNSIGEEAADDIATILSHNMKLQTVELCENNLQSADAIKIARSLQNTVTLTYLNLSSNSIGEEAADDIATVLSHNMKLQTVELGGNNLQSAGIIKIARGLQNTVNLTWLSLSSNSIGEEAADDIAAVLSHNTKLQILYLDGNNLQSAGAIKIARGLQNTVNLTSLGLSNNNVTEEATDDIAAVLSHSAKLQELYLDGNNLQSAGIIKIARGLQNTVNLIWLNLSSNSIGEEAADDIATVLSHNMKLQTVQLGGNNLQSAGIIKIARGLQNTVNLTWLSLSSNSIGEEAADDIAAVLSHNLKLRAVELGGNNLQSAGAIKIARGLQNTVNLISLGLNNNNVTEEAADDIAAVLSHNTKIQELYLVENNLQSAGAIKIARGLQNTVNLTLLTLSSNSIGEEAADDIAAVLSHNTKLQELCLDGNNLQSAGAIKIAKALQNTVNLTALDLSNNNVTEEAADDIAAVLSHNLKLQTVGLGGNNLQSAGAIKIAKALQNTVNLTSFGLSNNNVREEAVDDIAAVLSHNTKLQKLYLVGNNLQTEGAIKIARALQKTENLTLLNLSNNNIGEEAADDIAAVLSHNTKLQKLYLEGNNLQSAGAIKIARGLRNTVNLTLLNLSSNNIGEEATDDIAAVLSHNTKLQELCLDGNNLQSAGAIKIAKALQNLTLLNLSRNNINEGAADDIAAVLSCSTKLVI